MITRATRLGALAAAGVLVVCSFAYPASAKKKESCSLFTPGVEGAEGAPIAQVTDSATVETPLTIEYEHGPSVRTVVQETKYFNVQIYSRRSHPGIFVRQEFDNFSDIDLMMFNNSGKQVAQSTAFNPAPARVGPVDGTSNGTGALGYESISGFRAGRCDQYTVASAAMLTKGTPVTLKIWLGRPS